MGDGQGVLSRESQPRVCRSTRTSSPRGQGAPANAKAADQDGDGDDATVVADVAGGNFGNAGWMFLNCCVEGTSQPLSGRASDLLKSSPAMFVGLAGCDCDLEKKLQSFPEAVGSYEFLTLRGGQSTSVLLATRVTTGKQLDWVSEDESNKALTELATRRHGSNGNNHKALSRAIIGDIHTDTNIGHIGKHHKVLVMQLHRVAAWKQWPEELDGFWDWLALELKTVTVLMGDFGMALFRVVPALRSRGVMIDMAAWFPWKRWNGTPCADCSGIFFVNKPGHYKLVKGLEDLHANNPHGILWDFPNIATVTSPSLPGRPNDSPPPFAFFDDNGPGLPLSSFLPYKSTVADKLRVSLTPSVSPDGLAQKLRDGSLFKVHEKRLRPLSADRHYPLCAFTKNQGLRRRSKHAKRDQRYREKQKEWAVKNSSWRAR